MPSRTTFAATALALLFACGGGGAPPPGEETAPAETPGEPAAKSEADVLDTANPVVEMKTSKGTMKIELDREKAPKTVENFLGYVRDGFYDGTIFHRVIEGFMIQGGGFTPDMTEKETRAPIENEAANGLRNLRGTIAMARTNDPHSASAQFFINTVDNPFLDHTGPTVQGYGYAVFGKVVEGLEVVDAIKTVPTSSKGGHDDVPVDAVVIQSVRIIN